MYEKQIKQLVKQIEELAAGSDPTKPWDSVDKIMIDEGLKNPEFVKTIALMASGAIVSMCIVEESIMKKAKEDCEVDVQMAVTNGCSEVIAIVLLRAIALGIRSQQAVSEVELLESLAQR